MDLDLAEFLACIDNTKNDVLRRSIENVLGQITPALETVTAPGDRKYLEPAARLVWLAAHYTAAPAASHGFQVAYLEGSGGASLEPCLPRLAETLPTSTIVSVTRDGAAPKFIRCGGEQSVFEKNDIGFMEHESAERNRSAALIINLGGMGPDRAWIYDIIAQQSLLAYVCVIRDPNEGAILSTDAGSKWDVTLVNLGAVAVDVYRNTDWSKRIGGMKDFRFKIETGTADAQAYRPDHTVRVVGADQFSGLTVFGGFPSETVAGPMLNIYELEADGRCVHRAGRTAEQKTAMRGFMECDNINVSCGDLIWKDDVCLYDPGSVSHNFVGIDAYKKNFRPGGTVPVPRTATALKGTYFLCPTVVPHHSHLMFETLRRLAVAEAYGNGIKLLMSSLLTPSQRDYFHLFGFDESRQVYRGVNDTVTVEKLVFTLEPAHKFDRLAMDYFRRIGLRYYDPKSSRNKLIYFSRRDARKYRNLVNEIEIEAVFKSFGFDIVMASDLSAQEKVEMMSTARFVAGALGAAHFYCAFSAMAEMIVLTSSLYFPQQFMEINALRPSDIHFIKGVGMKFYNEPWQYEHSAFYVDPNVLRMALARILKVA